MAKDFLLEIGLEEMPAQVVLPSQKQLEKRVIDFLENNNLDYESLKAFSTPRRLAIQVKQIVNQQPDSEEEIKGPAKKIALDEKGEWSKAALGFLKGQNLTPEAVTFKEFKGEDYLYVTKYQKGKPVEEILTGLKDCLTAMTFPVSMHWGNHTFKYIRPIHWIIALVDETIIPFEIVDIKTSNISRGHRFLGEEVKISHALDYEDKLAKEFVIVDAEKRKEAILSQMAKLIEERKWKITMDDSLLEEVVNLVEFPTVFAGSFSDKYLSVPTEVLVTSMKEHQRYFEVYSQENQLLPFFISVRNGDHVHLENVIRGNEKVLAARLEDAAFFYKEDQKVTIDEYVEKLKNVTFHEKIGSVYEKMTRVATLAQLIGKQLQLSTSDLLTLNRVSQIYKFDLVSHMVGEFPELQGVMGEKYALLQGETKEVALAIREHYLPNSSEGDLPASEIGAILSVADKLDSLLQFFANGMIPTGSNDPYALRRQAYGIVRMIQEKNWQLSFTQLGMDFSQASQEGMSEAYPAVIKFIKQRLKQWLSNENIRYDIVEAAVESQQDNLVSMAEVAETLTQHVSDQDFKETIEALTRVVNLVKKVELPEVQMINPDLFENRAERELFEATQALQSQLNETKSNVVYEDLWKLKPIIQQYFAETMVMTEDEILKSNRLNQLRQLAAIILPFASLDLLVVK